MTKKKLENLDTRSLIRRRKWARSIYILAWILVPLWVILSIIAILFFNSHPDLKDIIIFFGLLVLFAIVPEKKRIEKELARRGNKL